MARYNRKGKINWLILTLYTGSFLRFLMEDLGYVLEEGIVLIADNEFQARQFISGYSKNIQDSGFKVENSKKQKFQIPNYACGFLYLRNGINENDVLDFLEEKDFLPVVVCGGFLPQYLRDSHYIFRLKTEEMEALSDKNTPKKIERFREFIINHVPYICEMIAGLEKCIVVFEYKVPTEMKELFSVFLGISRIYAFYICMTESEREMIDFFNSYIKESKERIEKIQDFADGEEIPELLSKLVWEYLYKHKEVYIVDVYNIVGEAYTAIYKKSAIIFDDKYYWFPHELFMRICEPLLQTMSQPELKRRLREEGILYCNSADYTVKKCLANSYGVTDRIRVLLVHKDCLLSPENLRLEDFFEVISENKKNEEESICTEVI